METLCDWHHGCFLYLGSMDLYILGSSGPWAPGETKTQSLVLGICHLTNKASLSWDSFSMSCVTVTVEVVLGAQEGEMLLSHQAQHHLIQTLVRKHSPCCVHLQSANINFILMSRNLEDWKNIHWASRGT